MYRWIDRQTDRQIGRQEDRQRDRYIERESDRQIERRVIDFAKKKIKDMYLNTKPTIIYNVDRQLNGQIYTHKLTYIRTYICIKDRIIPYETKNRFNIYLSIYIGGLRIIVLW